MPEDTKTDQKPDQQTEPDYKAIAAKAAADYAAAQSELAAAKAAADKVAAENADLKSKYDTLAKAEADRLAKVESANKARIAALPEADRALVPDGMGAEATAAHLARLEARLSKPVGISATGKGSGPADEAIPEDATREAQVRGKDPAWYYKTVWKPLRDAAAKIRG